MAGKLKILVVDDELPVCKSIASVLENRNSLVETALSGEEALKKDLKQRYDLIITDLMMPGISGLEVCQAMRKLDACRDLPVVMLTARGEESDIVAGLDLGADDYVTKPFSPKVLISRIKAIMRRREQNGAEGGPEQETPVRLGELEVDPIRFEARVEGAVVSLTLTEFNILKLLARRAGWVFTRQQIIDAIRGYDYSISLRAVDVHVFSLRKKLGRSGPRLESVRGIGYRVRA